MGGGGGGGGGGLDPKPQSLNPSCGYNGPPFSWQRSFFHHSPMKGYLGVGTIALARPYGTALAAVLACPGLLHNQRTKNKD